MAQRLIDLAAAILHELAAWRRQYPQDAAVHAFGLMEKHVGDLQGYFEQKQKEMHEEPATVDTRAATAETAAEAGALAQV